jgi:hypothetical protein
VSTHLWPRFSKKAVKGLQLLLSIQLMPVHSGSLLSVDRMRPLPPLRFLGLLIEITFIATFTQRFFAR